MREYPFRFYRIEEYETAAGPAETTELNPPSIAANIVPIVHSRKYHNGLGSLQAHAPLASLPAISHGN
jgi:hypothetical protein